MTEAATPAPSAPPASDLATSRRFMINLPRSEADLQADAGHPRCEDVGDPAERPAQVGNGNRSAAVDQVEYRKVHVHRVPVGGSEPLCHAKARHGDDGTLLRAELLHPQRD